MGDTLPVFNEVKKLKPKEWTYYNFFIMGVIVLGLKVDVPFVLP